MSCEGNRRRFFEHAAALPGSGLSLEALEQRYQAGRCRPASSAERAAAQAKTRRVFAWIEGLGLHPPTHSPSGLPRIESQLGYAAVYDLLKQHGLLSALAQGNALQQVSDPALLSPAIGLDGRDADGFDHWGYDREGFDHAGYDREGFDRQGYNRQGLNRCGYNHYGFDAKGYNSAGFDRKNLDRRHCDQRGYNRKGRDREGYDEDGYDAEGYDRQGYDREGKDRSGSPHPYFASADLDGFYDDGLDADGFDRDGYNAQGVDRYGFGRDGYNRHGNDRRGLKRCGRNADNVDPSGYDQQGFGSTPDGRRDRLGYGEDGLDPQGYSWSGYDASGLDRQGRPRTCRDRKGVERPCRFCKSGWDRQGYDRWGFHKDSGLTAPDAQGRRYNLYGWVYEEATRECVDPADPARRMRHKFDYDKGNGRVVFKLRYVPDTPEDPGPPPVTPLSPMTLEEFTRTLPAYNRHSAAFHYNLCQHPTGDTVAERWQCRARVGYDPQACRGGVLLRCPHCGQFTGGDAHHCPQFNEMVKAYPSGVVSTTYGSRILRTPHNPNHDPDYPDGYNDAGYDKDGFDRLGCSSRGFSREGYTPDGYDVLGYDRDGHDRQGYNNAGFNRQGEKRARTLASLQNLLDPQQDLLSNQDLANLYSQVATGLVGQPRRVVLQEGGGFGTDMRGTITADPYPLGRDADPRHNLVVTRAGIHHELGHELFTPPEVWAQVLEIAQGKQAVEGLGEVGAKLLPRFFNVVEDGRMERRLAGGYAGVAEVLAASCRLEPRWGEQVGEDVPAGEQAYWALLYTALPYYRVRQNVREGMARQAREVFEELEPLVQQAVKGDAEQALAAAIHLARRFEEEGLIALPREEYSQPLQPPPGTRPRQGQPQAGSGSHQGGSGKPAEGGEGEKCRNGAEAGSSQAGEEQMQGGSSAGGSGMGGSDQPPSGQGSAGESGTGQDVDNAGSLGDPQQELGQEALEAALRSVEREAAAAIESGVRRRARKDAIGRPLHHPLGSAESAPQRYLTPQGAPEVTHVLLPRASADLAKKLEGRRSAHKAVAARLAQQLKAVREQTEQILRRQPEGRLDRHRLVDAVKGMQEVRSRTHQLPRTSFAVSLAVDLSGSMHEVRQSGALYDAAMTLGDTFDLLQMPYEVRGFGSQDAQLKAMGETRFDPERAACLTTLDLVGTVGQRTAALGASALLAREERNRLLVTLSDGEMGDHDETARVLQQARQDGIVTFGVFLGSGADERRMNELYGAGNWTAISTLADMPAKVGDRLVVLFKRLRR